MEKIKEGEGMLLVTSNNNKKIENEISESKGKIKSQRLEKKGTKTKEKVNKIKGYHFGIVPKNNFEKPIT